MALIICGIHRPRPYSPMTMQKSGMMKIQMRLSFSISQKPPSVCAAWSFARSAASAACTASFSSAVSQRALAGRSGSSHNSAIPSSTEGTPSSSSIHCQPERPNPRRSSSQPDSGPPITDAIGTAARNRAMKRPRVAAGNQ